MMAESYDIGLDGNLDVKELSAYGFELYPIPMHTYLHESWSCASASSCWH